MKIHYSIVFCCVLLLISMTGCEDNAATSSTYATPQPALLVSNEGAFQQLNASIAVIDPNNEQIHSEVFNMVNDEALGDILQGLAFANNKVYALMNGSNKIVVFDEDNFRKTTEIGNIPFPNYMHISNATTAYLTTSIVSTLKEISLSDHTITRSIAIPGQAQEVVEYGNHLFVSSYTPYTSVTPFNHLYVVDRSSLSIVDSIMVGTSPSALQLIDEKTLAVHCAGTFGEADASIHLVDLESQNSTQHTYISFDRSYSSRLAYNPSAEVLYTLATNGVMGYDIKDLSALPVRYYETGADRNIYALTYDNDLGNLYIGNAYDFNSLGELGVLNSDYELVKTYTTGIAPNHIYLR